MNKKNKKLYLVNIVPYVFLLFSFFSLKVNAETEIPVDISIQVDDMDAVIVHGLTVGYDNNTYVSLRDLQKLLVATKKDFSLALSENEIAIDWKENGVSEILGADSDMEELDEDVHGWTSDERNNFTNKALAMKPIQFNGEERRYYTVSMPIGGVSDCLVSMIDFCMLFDLYGKTVNETIYVDTANPFQPVTPTELEADGYFQSVNSVLVGDATTGEIYYGYHEDHAYPIASTTKLMTYLLTAEAIERGDISEQDVVTISKEAELLSKTSDGVTPMKEGQEVTVAELLEGALIVSSNECDHAISEYLYGDEDQIVKHMNDRAKELEMNTAEFYSCNGLPIYTKNLVAAKKQNRMSSEDMFRMVSYLLNHYPQVKNITSKKEANLEVLKKEIKNTNPILYNIPEVNGLKTGTTNKSGACLVSSLTVNDGYTDHDIVVVLFGAENNQDRGRVSELLARYGKAVVQGECSKAVVGTEDSLENNTLDANSFVTMIVNRAMQMKP